MGKVIDITDILALRKAVRILELLDKDYDYDYDVLKAHPNICREIIVLFGKELDKPENSKNEYLS